MIQIAVVYNIRLIYIPRKFKLWDFICLHPAKMQQHKNKNRCCYQRRYSNFTAV